MTEELEQYLQSTKLKREKLKKLANKIEISKKSTFFPNLSPKRFKKFEQNISSNLYHMFNPSDSLITSSHRSQSHPKKRLISDIYSIPIQKAKKSMKLPPVKPKSYRRSPTFHEASEETSPSMNSSQISSKFIKLHYFHPSLLTPVLHSKYLN